MKLNKVTITGADDKTEIQELVEMSRQCPFVEWGILISNNCLTSGSKRFPSIEWVREFTATASENGLSASAHLCGKYVRHLLRGDDIIEVPLGSFQRVQLNFHDERCACDADGFVAALRKYPHVQWIFQIDRTRGWDYFTIAKDAGIDCAPLFDTSGGIGLLPSEVLAREQGGSVPTSENHWPQPLPYYHGYAGGLSPDNVAEQIGLIESRPHDETYWIDVETRVRSSDDEFDNGLTRSFLEASAPFLAT